MKNLNNFFRPIVGSRFRVFVSVFGLLFMTMAFQNCANSTPTSGSSTVDINRDVPPMDIIGGALEDTGDVVAPTTTGSPTSGSATPYSVTKSVNGSLASLNMAVSITFESSHLGKSGVLFIAIQLASGKWYFGIPGFSVVEYNGTPTAYGAGSIPSGTHVIVLAQEADLRDYAGAKVFVGYGVDSIHTTTAWDEMLAAGRFVEVHTL